MSSKYTILIEAKVDEILSKATIQSGLDAVSQQVNFKVKDIQIDAASLKALRTQVENSLKGLSITTGNASPATSPTGGTQPGGMAPPGTPSNLTNVSGRSDLISIEQVTDATGTLIKQTDKYRDSLAKTTAEIYTLDKTTGQFSQTLTVESENINKNAQYMDRMRQTLQDLSIAEEKLKFSSVATESGLPQPQQIQEVSAAIDNYSNKIREIQSRGGPVTNSDVQQLNQLDIAYKNSIENLKLYEKQMATFTQATREADQTIKQQISSMEQLSAAQKQIDASNNNISNSRLGSEAPQVQELVVATENYQNILNQVKAHGPIISAQDNALMAEAELRMQAANVALKQEVASQKEIADAIMKNNVLDKQRVADIEQQIIAAKKLTDESEKMLVGKSGKQITDSNRSLTELRAATQDLTKARNSDNASIAQAEERLKNATVAQNSSNEAVRAGGKNLQSWGTEIGVAIKRTIEWAGAMTLLYGSLRQIEQGIQYVKDLNKELVNIQLVTGATSEQVSQMSVGFNELAGQLGATTKEVAQGSLEWYRQGKTAEETAVLLKDSTMMAKLANLDAAQSTEYMTSIMNGFQLQAKDMMDVLDSLVNLDNRYATSVGEIADAMQRSSNSAMQSGVSLNTLASYITVIESTTRKSSESVGESLKTMFARFENIKMGNMDEEGASINNVEAALKRVNIVLRDTPTSFRNLSDVISELGGKWNSLNQLEQDNLAVQIAGVRQRENFLVLMNNWNKVLEAQAVANDSAGLAAKRYDIYLGGLEATTNRFTVAWEKLASNAINSDFIKQFIDMGTSMVGVINTLGGLIPVLENILTILLVFKSANFVSSLGGISTIMSQISSAWGAGLTLTTSLESGLGVMTVTIGGLVIAVASLVAIWYTWNKEIKETQEAGQKGVASAFTDIFKNSGGLTGTEIIDKYAASLERVNDSIKQYGILASLFVDKQKITESGFKATIDALNNAKLSYVDYNISVQRAIQLAGLQQDAQGVYTTVVKNNGQVIKQYVSDVKILTQAEIEQQHSVEETNKAITNQTERLNLLRKIEGLPELSTATKDAIDFTTALKNMSDAILKTNDSMQVIIKSQTDNGEISMDQVDILKTQFGENNKYLDLITVENGKIILNTQALKDLLKAKVDDIITTLKQTEIAGQNNDAIEKQIDLWIAYKQQIQDGTTDIKNSAKEQKAAYDDLLKTTINMIKEQKNAEKQALQDELSAYKDVIDQKKQLLQDLADKRKQDLQDQLDGYKSIIDAEIALIDQKQKEADFEQTVADKNKQIADIDAELLALQFDNSEEANAKRLKLLADKAAKQKELDKIQNDHTVQSEKDALNEELKNFEDNIKKQQRAIDDNLKSQLKALDAEYKAYEANNKAKIKLIEEYLANTGTMTADAIALLNTHAQTLMDQLIEYNKKFGTSIDEDIIKKWKDAFDALYEYGVLLSEVQAVAAAGSGGENIIPPIAHHSGVNSGFVGGVSQLSSNEEFAKLLKGELVVTPKQMDNFMNNVVPNINNNNGSVNISMPITVGGNLDKGILPQLKETILTVVNDAMKDRGNRRGAYSFSV